MMCNGVRHIVPECVHENARAMAQIRHRSRALWPPCVVDGDKPTCRIASVQQGRAPADHVRVPDLGDRRRTAQTNLLPRTRYRRHRTRRRPTDRIEPSCRYPVNPAQPSCCCRTDPPMCNHGPAPGELWEEQLERLTAIGIGVLRRVSWWHADSTVEAGATACRSLARVRAARAPHGHSGGAFPLSSSSLRVAKLH